MFSPGIISLLSPLSLAIEVTDATLRAIGLWLGTRTGAGGTDTLDKRFLGLNPCFDEQQQCSLFLMTETGLLNS